MRTVHKFPIDPSANGWFEIEMPRYAKPVMVSGQMGKAHLWAEVFPDNPSETRRFQIVATGQPIADGHQHVGSFMTNNGAFVWHVYEAKS